MTGPTPIFALAWAWLAGWLMHGVREGVHEGVHEETVVRNELARAMLIVAPVALIGASNTAGGRFSAATVGLCALCLLFGHRVSLPARVSRLFLYLGELSYPLYLCHIIVAIALWHFHVRTAEPFLLASLALAALIHHGVELPLRNIVRKRAKSKRVAQEESSSRLPAST